MFLNLKLKELNWVAPWGMNKVFWLGLTKWVIRGTWERSGNWCSSGQLSPFTEWVIGGKGGGHEGQLSNWSRRPKICQISLVGQSVKVTDPGEFKSIESAHASLSHIQSSADCFVMTVCQSISSPSSSAWDDPVLLTGCWITNSPSSPPHDQYSCLKGDPKWGYKQPAKYYA